MSRRRGLEHAELGDKAAPFTKYGKNYSNDQLRDMYQRVGWFALGLPAFGPNILRTVHVTTIMTLCYHMDIKVDDQRVKDHFALARHGEYEMQRSYNLIKAETAPYDPGSFSARVSGIVSAQKMLESRSQTAGFDDEMRANQSAALGKCLGDSLFDGLKRQEGESSLETMMRELLKQTSQVISMQRGGVSTENVSWTPEAIDALNESRKEEHMLKAAKLRAERQEVERKSGLSVGAEASCKGVESVDEGQDTGRKRGLSASAGGSCKSVENVDEDNKPARKRVKRGTWSAERMPLLRRMNAIFKGQVVEMKLDPTKKYKRVSQENAMFHVTAFRALSTERVRSYLQQKCKDNADVKEFYELNPTDKNIADCLSKAQKEGQVTKWSDWLCRKCKKVECECPGQEN